jgi:hypothetical protein
MLTNNFQQLLMCFFCVVFIFLVTYALYCRNRYHSYIGTGRVTEIELWQTKATVTWICTFCLSLALVIKLL